jgi:hypothetical protein
LCLDGRCHRLARDNEQLANTLVSMHVMAFGTLLLTCRGMYLQSASSALDASILIGFEAGVPVYTLWHFCTNSAYCAFAGNNI